MYGISARFTSIYARRWWSGCVILIWSGFMATAGTRAHSQTRPATMQASPTAPRATHSTTICPCHMLRDARIWLVCAGLSGSSVSFARVHTNDSTSVDVCVCVRSISRAGTRPPSSAYSAQRASVLQTSWMQGESPPYTSRVSSSPPGTERIRGRGMQSCSRTGKAFAIRM